MGSNARRSVAVDILRRRLGLASSDGKIGRREAQGIEIGETLEDRPHRITCGMSNLVRRRQAAMLPHELKVGLDHELTGALAAQMTAVETAAFRPVVCGRLFLGLGFAHRLSLSTGSPAMTRLRDARGRHKSTPDWIEFASRSGLQPTAGARHDGHHRTIRLGSTLP
jgi:hypothetical protein